MNRPETITTLTDLWDWLETHDWHFAMSDSHEVWVRGNADWRKITNGAAPLGEPAKSMIKAFQDYHNSGPAYRNEKAPKPERPV